jgi:betaine-aldehyde dehydrogenase
MKELRNFVGGKWTDAASGRQAELINPSTGEAFATAPVSEPDDADAAFRSAADGVEGCRGATPSK